MLSITSVSSIGNIHRRVIVFPFVVPSSGSVWWSEGVSLDGGWIFLSKWTQCRGAKDSSQVVSDWLWQKALPQSFSRLCRLMLEPGPSVWTSSLWRCAQKSEAKERAIDSSLLFWQMKDSNALFSSSSQLFLSDAEVLSRLRVKIFTVLSVELTKTTDSDLAQVHPFVWFWTLCKPEESQFPLKCLVLLFFCCWKALKRSTLCSFGVPVPAVSAMCKCLEWRRNFYNVAAVESVSTARVPGLVLEGS